MREFSKSSLVSIVRQLLNLVFPRLSRLGFRPLDNAVSEMRFLKPPKENK